MTFVKSVKKWISKLESRESVSPEDIIRLGGAFLPSNILLSAVELGVFTTLAENGPMTHLQIREALQLHPRATPDLTDALLSINMLRREGDGDDARYTNTPETALFLDENRQATYVGKTLINCIPLVKMWREHAEMIKDRKHGYGRLERIVSGFNREARTKVFKAQRNGESHANESNLSSKQIFEVGFGFWSSRVLLTACELNLFTIIEEGEGHKMNAKLVAKHLNINKEVASDFLDALVDCRMLNREGAMADHYAKYSNTRNGAMFLVRTKPSYVGGMHEFFGQCCYR